MNNFTKEFWEVIFNKNFMGEFWQLWGAIVRSSFR